ncbi:hypothetical protein, partial [Synechococcus sp. UW179A]|uniref:hypothetical protein n=1 Tax=Synechococcus sp. UW179A TaxID=2575510 RepID=UPI0010BED9AC
MAFTLEWPTSVVRIQSGSEVSLYGYVQDGRAGEELQVQIRHLDSGQYWRPDGTFGDVMNHQATVVDSSGHWRLMHTPQAAGEYEMVVVYTDAERKTGARSTTFNVLGDTYVNPFAVSADPEINGSIDSGSDEFDDANLMDNTEFNKDSAELIEDSLLSASAASFTLEWPTSVVRIQSGSEVSLYGYVQDGRAGEELQVQIRHLDSGQYWRPDGTFGDVMNHQATVVDSSGHWRLMHTPQAAGEYEMVVVYTDAERKTGARSTTFNVLGDTYVNPFAVSA